ncbi:PNK3P-domain-containing protein [Wallemia mellicola]|nr:PNK3P-domain-containing protein [Wallemia mellicola]
MTTRQSTLNFSKKASKIIWKHNKPFNQPRTIIFGVYGQFVPHRKIAAFDLDGTLIKPKSGSTFPKHASDWKFLHKNLKERLSSLIDDGYAVIIISNQNYESRPAKLEEWQRKLEFIGDKLEDIPFVCMAATSKDENRKPNVGMWECLERYLEAQEVGKPDISQSFYVGDAAGRPKENRRPADHSSDDLNFAKNLDLQFFTPEEYF